MIAAQTLISDATKKLNGIADNPWREARLLLAYVLDKSYEEIFFQENHWLRPIDKKKFELLLKRRINHEPLSKIIGLREFWSLPFRVTADTLDPRPDSETLIEAVLAYYPDKTQPLHILDLGTGTGCLLLSLLHEYPHAWGVGMDYSEAASQIALENARRLHLNRRSAFMVGNWADALVGTFDIIISNPPYIGYNERLPLEVAQYDPPLALYAGDDGLAHYQALAHQIPRLAAPHSKIFLEIGAQQKNAVTSIFSSAQHIHVIQDLQGYSRGFVFSVGSINSDSA